MIYDGMEESPMTTPNNTVAGLAAILRDRAKASEVRGYHHAQWSEGVRFAANQIEAALASPAPSAAVGRHWCFAAAEGLRPLVERMVFGGGALGRTHLLSMLDRMQREEMSATKGCRWLGWIQAALVDAGPATLEMMKAHNLSYSRESPPAAAPRVECSACAVDPMICSAHRPTPNEDNATPAAEQPGSAVQGDATDLIKRLRETAAAYDNSTADILYEAADALTVLVTHGQQRGVGEVVAWQYRAPGMYDWELCDRRHYEAVKAEEASKAEPGWEARELYAHA